MKVTLNVLVLALLFIQCHAQKQLAFPGADGFGKYTVGGRGGQVVIVSNLNDDGPGSLRAAIKKQGPRTIVFSVSGNIELESPLFVNNVSVTIAGQSAPGDGICIKNYPIVVQADEVIIRYLRFRLGDERGIESDAASGTKGKSNIIIDHCSFSWATDECASFYRNKNFTMQWCIISESLNQSVHHKGEHGYGGIWGGEGASFHHNLFAHHNSRLPRFSGSSTTPNSPDELVDFRNNVIFNWGHNNTYGGERGRYNMVGNYYKPGPASKGAKSQVVNPSSPYGRFYLSGNVVTSNENVAKDNRLGVKAAHPDSALVQEAFKVESVFTQDAKDGFDSVLKLAGASYRRDAVDTRIVEEVRTGQATHGKLSNGIIDSQKDVGGWPELKSLTAPKDTDADGMPDAWESSNGLNATDKSDAIKQSVAPGYDNLEVYLNSLLEK